MIELPRLFTARYMAEGVLSPGEVVPVRISHQPPSSRSPTRSNTMSPS